MELELDELGAFIEFFRKAAVDYATVEDGFNKEMSSAIRQRLFEANRRAYLSGAQVAYQEMEKRRNAEN